METEEIINIIYWTFIEKELEEIKDIFENIFEGLSLNRDYEDTWEWLEGKNGFLEINISRKHDWIKGLYDTELIINVKTKNKNIDYFGEFFLKKLSRTIYYGKKIYIGNNNYKFIPIKIWEQI